MWVDRDVVDHNRWSSDCYTAVTNFLWSCYWVGIKQGVAYVIAKRVSWGWSLNVWILQHCYRMQLDRMHSAPCPHHKLNIRHSGCSAFRLLLFGILVLFSFDIQAVRHSAPYPYERLEVSATLAQLTSKFQHQTTELTSHTLSKAASWLLELPTSKLVVRRTNYHREKCTTFGKSLIWFESKRSSSNVLA